MLELSFTPFPRLATKRLLLRQLEQNDESDIFALRSNKNVNKYLGRNNSTNIAETQEFIRNINNGITKNEWIYWAITLKEKTNPIGTICLWNISKENLSAETGYELLPTFQGNGIIQEALLKVIEFGFQQLKLKTIEAYSHIDNIKSIHLLEKFNFKRIEYKSESKEAIYSLNLHRWKL